MSVLSLEKIYNDYYGKVMGYIMARVRRRAEAEDIASDVFEKIVRKIDDFDETKASVSTWVFTITRNTLIDHYRRTKPSEELDENLAEDGELDEDLLRSETLGELADALRSMPEQLRAIIVMRYYDGKTLTEIAKIMDLSYGAVKLRHQNALEILRRSMNVFEER